MTEQVEPAVHVLQGVFAFMYLSTGMPKLFSFQYMVDGFRKFGYPRWFLYVIGLLEVAGGAGFAVSFWHPAAASAAGLMLLPVMIGVTWTNYTKTPTKLWIATAVIGLLVGFIGFYRLPELRAALL